MKHIFTQLALICLIAQSSFAEAKKIVITGSSTIAPVISEIAKKYEELNKDIRIDVQTGGSSRGINDVHQGLSNIGMSSRDLSKKEKNGVNVQTIAIDGVAFVVNAKNPIVNLSSTQISRVIRGEVNNWNELDGANAEIVFINRAKGRSELELVSEYLKIPAEEMQADLIAGENQEVVKLVSQNENAISYLSLGTAESEIENKAPIRMPALNGVPATSKQVAEKNYPLTRPLILITGETPNQDVEDFVKFSLLDESQALFEQNSFIRAQ